MYAVNKVKFDSSITKRKIASEIAKIYDQLGLLGTVIFYAKSILQKLWIDKIGWDESVPSHIYTLWFERKVLLQNSQDIQMHGFSDASEEGYGACIYVRSVHGNHIQTRLLCAKSRVAPLKKLSTPRLELNAAELLTSLCIKTFSSIRINVS